MEHQSLCEISVSPFLHFAIREKVMQENKDEAKEMKKK